jgi:hypothetical protein
MSFEVTGEEIGTCVHKGIADGVVDRGESRHVSRGGLLLIDAARRISALVRLVVIKRIMV